MAWSAFLCQIALPGATHGLRAPNITLFLAELSWAWCKLRTARADFEKFHQAARWMNEWSEMQGNTGHYGPAACHLLILAVSGL